MPLMHFADLLGQRASLFRRPNTDRASIVNRALVHEIAVLDHFFDVVGDVRPEIAASQCYLPDRHLGITDAEQHHGLHAVDVLSVKTVELKFDNLQLSVMKALNQGMQFKIKVLVHSSS